LIVFISGERLPNLRDSHNGQAMNDDMAGWLATGRVAGAVPA